MKLIQKSKQMYKWLVYFHFQSKREKQASKITGQMKGQFKTFF